MADLNEIKDINADLPLTNFPDEIDELESFSDADDEINSAIITYKNLMKQGETAKAEELYEKYSLKKYIVSAYFLNKIQHMIIACERSISSVKKYFSFSTDAPTGTTSQPNGYLWGKILSTGNGFKKVLLKLKDNGTYVDIFPQTTADNVIISESDGTTVKDKLDDATTALDTKMNKENPMGSGALSVNRNGAVPVGKNSVAVGNGCTAQGENGISIGDSCSAGAKNSVAIGDTCQSLKEGSITQGKGLVANSAHQIVQGKYNTIGNYAYILGGGTSLSDTKNLFTVDWDGNAKANSFTADGDVIFSGNKSLTNIVNGLNGLKITQMVKDQPLYHGANLGTNVLIVSTHPDKLSCGMWIATLSRDTDPETADNQPYTYNIVTLHGGEKLLLTCHVSADISKAGITYSPIGDTSPVVFAINLKMGW